MLFSCRFALCTLQVCINSFVTRKAGPQSRKTRHFLCQPVCGHLFARYPFCVLLESHPKTVASLHLFLTSLCGNTRQQSLSRPIETSGTPVLRDILDGIELVPSQLSCSICDASVKVPSVASQIAAGHTDLWGLICASHLQGLSDGK